MTLTIYVTPVISETWVGSVELVVPPDSVIPKTFETLTISSMYTALVTLRALMASATQMIFVTLVTCAMLVVSEVSKAQLDFAILKI